MKSKESIEMDEDIVRDAINSFYAGAGIKTSYNGPVNDKVAEVFGKMLSEAKRCSNALSWVPQPQGRKATVRWIASQFSRSIRERMKDSQYLTCAKVVILRMRTDLELAGHGI